MTNALRIFIKHCTCAYYDSEGEAVKASRECLYHPPGTLCPHGKAWNEPCMPCRDELWGKTS
jgi:hypothetical protein